MRRRGPRDDPIELPPIVVTVPQTTASNDVLQDFSAQRFARFDAPPYLQRAVVVIDGVIYNEWTSVEVRLAINENPPATFRLTVSEQEIPRDSTQAFRIVPGDVCEVFLDGYKAINGYVATRQAYYDGHAHQVEIQGFGLAGRLNYTAATSQTGEFKNTPGFSVIAALAASGGVTALALGGLSMLPLERHSITPGASSWEEIEKIARQIGGHLTEWPPGNLVVTDITTLGAQLGSAAVIEGVNILEAREVIHAPSNPGAQFPLIAQRTGNDQVSGSQAAQPFANVTGQGGFSLGDAATRSLMELPGWSQALMQLRARHESIVSATNQIQVTIGLVGWQRPGLGGLWFPGADKAIVDSPMLVLRNQELLLNAVTFTQDDRSGTRASIELINPEGQSPLPLTPSQ